MTTTVLFAEILVIGSIAQIWLVLLIFAVVSPDPANISTIVDSIGKLSTLLLFPFIATTYAVGWVMNFLSERLFRTYTQRRIRDKFFQQAGTTYSEVRGLFTQNASEKAVRDWEFDRHLVRMARSNFLNFLLIAVTLILYLQRFRGLAVVGIILALVLAVASLFQYLTRYRARYIRVFEVYKTLIQGDNRARESITPPN